MGNYTGSTASRAVTLYETNSQRRILDWVSNSSTWGWKCLPFHAPISCNFIYLFLVVQGKAIIGSHLRRPHWGGNFEHVPVAKLCNHTWSHATVVTVYFTKALSASPNTKSTSCTVLLKGVQVETVDLNLTQGQWSVIYMLNICLKNNTETQREVSESDSCLNLVLRHGFTSQLHCTPQNLLQLNGNARTTTLIN